MLWSLFCVCAGIALDRLIPAPVTALIAKLTAWWEQVRRKS